MTKGHDKGHKGQMSDREVMKLALEALEGWSNYGEWVWPESAIEQSKRDTKEAITALRQALDRVPDTMKMLEPDMGIDRGAWDDVPDATKWVDELRGDEPWDTSDMAYRAGGLSMRQEPVYAFRRKGLNDFCTCDKRRYDELASKPDLFEVAVFYTAPPKREWQGLTDEEIQDFGYEAEKFDKSNSEWFDRFGFARAIEAKLKEKNTCSQ